jgi:hypothetical protein
MFEGDVWIVVMAVAVLSRNVSYVLVVNQKMKRRSFVRGVDQGFIDVNHSTRMNQKIHFGGFQWVINWKAECWFVYTFILS